MPRSRSASDRAASEETFAAGLRGDLDVVLTRAFAAPPARVFDAFARDDRVRRWRGDRPAAAIERDAPLCLVRGARGDEPLVTQTFEPTADGGTHVTETHSYRTRADRDSAVADGAIDDAAAAFDRLDGLLDTFAAIDDGTALEIERSLDAPPEVVFEAWTRVEHLTRWFCPKDSPLRGGWGGTLEQLDAYLATTA